MRRDRLFRMLDALSSAAVVWIAGPPGAGKTVLASTWLQARRAPGLWYQLDAGDGDIGTFFYYLRQAAQAAGIRDLGSLPLLTAEYRDDVTGFSRRWFRALFTRLPARAVLALDNYQDVPPDSPLHAVLAAACDEVPESSRLLVMSWMDPPSEFARLVAGERLARIGPEALRVTSAEAALMAAGRGDALTAEQIEELHARSEGWAAGFTLLRERTRRTGLVNRIAERGTMQQVFDYFMTLVFRDIPADRRDAIVATAVLPRFTQEMAIELTGGPAIAELLDWLYRRHLFVERRYGSEVTYQYHALFRAFLVDAARRQLTPAAYADLSQRAAMLLQNAGMLEEAFELRIHAGDPGRAAVLLERLAPTLVLTGRGAALRRWLTALPESERRDRPVLSYWNGAALLADDLVEARAAYERAHAGFVRVRDGAGQAMAVAGVLHTFLLELADLAPVQQWLDVAGDLLAEDLRFPSDAIGVRVYGTLVGTMFWMAPRHGLLPVCVRRLEALLSAPIDDEGKVAAAGLLAEYYAVAGFVHDAARVVDAIDPIARRSSLSPRTRAYWLFCSSRRDYFTGDIAGARARVERARDVALEHGVKGALAFVYGILADIALDLGDAEAIPPLLEAIRGLGPQVHARNLAGRVHWILAKLAASKGELDEALTQFERACAVTSQTLVFARFSYYGGWFSALVERGELDRAREVLARRKAIVARDQFPYLAVMDDCLEAILAAAKGDTRPLAAVRDGLRRLEQLGAEIPFLSDPLPGRQLAELLVRHRIEPRYVTAWIRRLGIRPSSPDVPNWPWPVRIQTLGGFRVEIDGAPLRFSRKAPRKPLELLQAIVALGGNEIPCESLCDLLWPDSDGDTAAAALRVTVARLRTLLKRDVVVRQQGRISLDAKSCWVDLWSLRKLCTDVEAGLRDGAATRLRETYRGAFLEAEREAPWMLPIREEARRRFARAMAALER